MAAKRSDPDLPMVHFFPDLVTPGADDIWRSRASLDRVEVTAHLIADARESRRRLWNSEKPIANLRTASSRDGLLRIWHWILEGPIDPEWREHMEPVQLPFPELDELPEALQGRTVMTLHVFRDQIAEEEAGLGRTLTDDELRELVEMEARRAAGSRVCGARTTNHSKLMREVKAILSKRQWLESWLARAPTEQLALLILGDVFPQLAAATTSGEHRIEMWQTEAHGAIDAEGLSFQSDYSSFFTTVSINVFDVNAVSPQDVADLYAEERERVLNGRKPRQHEYIVERFALIELGLILAEREKRISQGEPADPLWRPGLSAMKAAWREATGAELLDPQFYRCRRRISVAKYAPATTRP